MINLEWLKSINSLLSQAIDIAEGEFSAGKWLDFATNTVKQLGSFSINPLSPVYSQENYATLHPDTPFAQGNGNSTDYENNGPAIHFLDLLKLLKPAQILFKQISTMEPIIRNIMNPKNVKPTDSKNSAIPNPCDNLWIKSPVLNTLVLALLPIVLLNFVIRLQ